MILIIIIKLLCRNIEHEDIVILVIRKQIVGIESLRIFYLFGDGAAAVDV